MKHPLAASLAAATLALLAGCVSAPTPPAPTAPWVPPERARNPDTGWEAARRETPAFTNALALADLADLALRNSPACRRAWSDARAAAAQVDVAQGNFMPAVVAAAGVDRTHTDASPATYDADKLHYGPSLQVNYLVINFGGGRRAAVEQALQTVYALDYTFNQAIQDTLLAVEAAYYRLVSAQAGVTAAQASTKDAAAALDAAQTRRKAGVATDLEVFQAQAARDQAAFNEADAAGQVRGAQAALALAVGVPGDVPLPIAAPAADVPAPLASSNLTAMIDAALLRRPDIAALRATVAAQEAATRVASAALWPNLYATGQAAANAFDLYAGRDTQNRDWTVGAGLALQWTLFDGWQTVGARRAAQAQAESARARLRQAELAASADIWSRYHDYATALEKFRASAALLASSQAAYDLALGSYQSGLRSLLDLLNAESQLALARSQNVAARQAVFVALATLAHAAGALDQADATTAETRLLNTQEGDRP